MQQPPPVQTSSTRTYPRIRNMKELESLLVRNRDRLQRFILKNIKYNDVAEDLFQNTCVEATRAYHNFRGESAPSTWLFGIARNIIRNHVHRSPTYRYNFVDTEALSNTPCDENNPEQAVEHKEHISQVDVSVGNLPPKLSEVLKMVVSEHSYEDIAARLGISVGTVRSRLSRARTQLKRKMGSRSLEGGSKVLAYGSTMYQRLRPTKSLMRRPIR